MDTKIEVLDLPENCQSEPANVRLDAAFQDEGYWKNPHKKQTDESTVLYVDIYYEKTIGSTNSFIATINHCRKFPQGKGFMGRSRSNLGGSSATTKFYAGTTKEVYEQTMEETLKLTRHLRS